MNDHALCELVNFHARCARLSLDAEEKREHESRLRELINPRSPIPTTSGSAVLAGERAERVFVWGDA